MCYQRFKNVRRLIFLIKGFYYFFDEGVDVRCCDVINHCIYRQNQSKVSLIIRSLIFENIKRNGNKKCHFHVLSY